MSKVKTRGAHFERIEKELQEAGFTKYAMLKFATKYLPNIIHQDEHIGGAVYGRYRTGTGLLSLIEGMLVATDKRVIFLDHKPGFTSYDEVTYDVVSGAMLSSAGFKYAVTLHTRVSDYSLRFANAVCARKFVDYVEKKRLEKSGVTRGNYQAPVLPSKAMKKPDNIESMEFLRAHHTGVLSTTNNKDVYGAVIHYLVSPEGFIYILTKSGTQKSHNIYSSGKVALTVYDSRVGQTVQLRGNADPETNQTLKDQVFNEMIKPRAYGRQKRLPPVVFLPEGSFTVIRISPTNLKFTDFTIADMQP